MRRSRLRGLEDVSKRYTIAAAAHNLAQSLRLLTGIGKPRALQGARGASALALGLIVDIWGSLGLRVGPTRPTAGSRPLAA